MTKRNATFDVDAIELLTILKEDATPNVAWTAQDLLKIVSEKAGYDFIIEKKDINSALYKLLRTHQVVKSLKLPSSVPLWSLNSKSK